MKNVIILLFAFLSACSSDTKSVKGGDKLKESVQSEDLIYSQSLKRQVIKVQDTPLEVTTAELKRGAQHSVFIFLIKSPSQTFSFKVYGENQEAAEGLSTQYLKILNDYQGAIENVDLRIDEMKSVYNIMNTLDLDRCRSVKVMPELTKIFTSKRKDLFLAISTSGGKKPVHMLKWDTESKKIVGLYRTYKGQHGYIGTPEEVRPLLAPNRNVLDENGALYASNMFLEAFTLSLHCSLSYERMALQSSEFKHLAGLRYQPFRQEEFDERAKWSIDYIIESASEALGIAQTIYDAPMDLSPEVIDYAQNHPLYKILSAE